jgi:superfamily I DNA/RNA helicase
MNDYEQLCRSFISKSKSLLIAPAGYGKTHTIVECLKYTNETQLILTHTHAGVASLKEKVKENGIADNKLKIETIASFAQKYVESFYCGDDVPEQDNNKEYFPFIIKEAISLVKISPIKDVIGSSYAGLFVDEYQDCTIAQHQFIMALSDILPLHILGDPLQGIFDFNNGKVVDFESDLKDFNNSCFKLSEPWRWKNTNPRLGTCLKEIREKLENKEKIDLTCYKDIINVFEITENDIYSPRKIYNRKLLNLLDTEDSLLLIYPDSQNFNARKKIVKKFNNRLYLVEAMDNKDFYYFSKEFDNCDSRTIYKKIHNVIYKIFNKTELDKWFNNDCLKNKQNHSDKEIQTTIRDYFSRFDKKNSYALISEILMQIKKIPNLKCYRKELFFDLCKALENAQYQNISVYNAMKNIRNTKRRIGRKIKGKCIGTTLLTKGLEFDAVVILNAHRFNCPKNLYVALTRASKRLFIFTNTMTLDPYK